MASKFKGASTAKVSESGEKCSDGDHLLELTRITMSDGKNGEYYIAEFKVLESTNPADPAGAQRVWTQNMAKSSFPLGKLNAFVYALAGFDIKNVKDAAELAKSVTPNMDEILDASVDESDPLGFIGRKVRATTRKQDGKSINPATGKPFPFTEYRFSPGQSDKMDLAA